MCLASLASKRVLGMWLENVVELNLKFAVYEMQRKKVNGTALTFSSRWEASRKRDGELFFAEINRSGAGQLERP